MLSTSYDAATGFAVAKLELRAREREHGAELGVGHRRDGDATAADHLHLRQDRMLLELREGDRLAELLHGLDVDDAPILVGRRILIGSLRDARDTHDLLAFARMVEEQEISLLHRA